VKHDKEFDSINVSFFTSAYYLCLPTIIFNYIMNKLLSLSFFILLSANLSAKDGYHRNLFADVIHYKFSVSVSDSSNVIYGHTVITVTFTGTVKTFELDLKNEGSDGKGMKIQKLFFDGGKIKWIHIGDKIFLTPDEPFSSGNTGVFTIDYSGIPSDGLIISDNKFGRRTFFADNWPDRAHNWLPCVDHPYEKATVDFLVTSPDHYKVVGSGYLFEESSMPSHTKLTHWREDVPLATKVMAIGIAPFATRFEGTVNKIPVWSWVFAENRNEGFSDYAVALKPMAYYSSQVGPYPYEKLADVQSKTIFGGLENAGCIFYAENSVTGQNKAESLMAHEIAHQWFGNSVTENDWHHIWLSEGFATYLTALYLEKTYGKEKLDETMIKARDRVLRFSLRTSVPVIDTTVTDLMQLLNPNSYQKGAWVLHMLRRKLGDELFWKGIQSYYTDYRDKNALTTDFKKAMERVSNISLESFFQQWLYVAGQPELKIYTEKTNGSTDLIIEQTQNNLFSFEIEIQIRDSSGIHLLTIPVLNRITKERVRGEISDIRPDPNTNLLFRFLQ
jgi:aminopeptidase N